MTDADWASVAESLATVHEPTLREALAAMVKQAIEATILDSQGRFRHRPPFVGDPITFR